MASSNVASVTHYHPRLCRTSIGVERPRSLRAQAKQSRLFRECSLDCFVACAPRNDELGGRSFGHES